MPSMPSNLEPSQLPEDNAPTDQHPTLQVCALWEGVVAGWRGSVADRDASDSGYGVDV